MEITRRFMKFLEELDDSQVREKYSSLELDENLQEIANKINSLKSSGFHKKSSLNELMLFEETVSEGCLQITKKLKENIDTVCLLHSYVTNFPLNSANIFSFLTVFCRSIFECSCISLLSADVDNAPSWMKMAVGQQIEDESVYRQAISELNKLMADKNFIAQDTLPEEILKPYLLSKNYVGNVVSKIVIGNSHFFLCLHFTKDSPFTGSYLSAKYYKDFPLTQIVPRESIQSVLENTFLETREMLLKKIETLKLELIEVHKAYFLSYIATEARMCLECDVATSVILGEEPLKPQILESDHKGVSIALSEGYVLKLENNFHWDNRRLNKQLSGYWKKLHKNTKFSEFYHLACSKTNDIIFEFSKNGTLIYQNSPVFDFEHEPLVEIRDFLKVPQARNYEMLFGKSEILLKIIQSSIEFTKESNIQLTRKEGELNGVAYEFIGRRKNGRKNLDRFMIILREPKQDQLYNSFDVLVTGEGDQKKITKIRKMRRSVQETKTAIGENADMDAIKKSIIAEYLPYDFTSNQPHKSIYSVNKIKLTSTSKTAFIDSHSLKHQSPVKSIEQIPPISNKPATLSVEVFKTKESDIKIFEDWSFDAVKASDFIEKSRLVWAMLNEFGLIKEFNIDLNVLCEFITRMKEKYETHNNSFHNFDHGITVMHGSFYILRHISTKFTQLVNLGILVSAFCHDADHTGRNNMFEVNSNSRLALRYHDKSVLEQHHAAVTFKVLSKETANIFSTIQGEDYKQLRKLIIANILATDMKVHFEVMSAFNELRERIESKGEENFTWNDVDVQAVTGMIVHSADVCGPTKEFNTAYNWAIRVNQEFSIQVREEKALGIPVTPYFQDLDKPQIMAKQEIGFISFMIKPLWENFNLFFGGAMKEAVVNIENNIAEWNVLLKIALEEAKAQEAEAANEKKE